MFDELKERLTAGGVLSPEESLALFTMAESCVRERDDAKRALADREAQNEALARAKDNADGLAQRAQTAKEVAEARAAELQAQLASAWESLTAANARIKELEAELATYLPPPVDAAPVSPAPPPEPMPQGTT